MHLEMILTKKIIYSKIMLFKCTLEFCLVKLDQLSYLVVIKSQKKDLEYQLVNTDSYNILNILDGFVGSSRLGF